MFRPIFNGIMNILSLGKRKRQAERILSGKEEATHVVHTGGSKFSHTKGGRYFAKAIAKRRMRNQMGKETRQRQRATA